jgi:hypothetical protein
MTDNADMSAVAEAKRDSVPAIPVRGRYYLTKCPHCGWVGSSEQCGVDYGCDDTDVYCPVCQEAGCEEDATCVESAEHGEAVMRRLTAALARAERLEAVLTSDEAVEAACNAFFSDPAAPWSLAVEGAPTLADEVRRRMRASLRAALSPAAEEAASQPPRAWPSGCIKRNSCARNRTCMYAQSPDQCRHFGKDIRADIEAAERDRERAAAASH